MNKALLIGGNDELASELNGRLSEGFQVKKCPPAMEEFLEAAEKDKPDLIVVVMSENFDDILIPFILSECPDTPLVAVGSAENEKALAAEDYLSSEWVRFIKTPASSDDVLDAADEYMVRKTGKKSFVGRRTSDRRGSASSSPQQDPVLGQSRGGIYSGPSGKQRASVLLVDDNPAALRAMQPILSRKYDVSFATSGSQAIFSLAEKKPDIILLDYEMPEIDGVTTLKMIRANDATKNIPVIFLTGIADFEHVIDALDLRPQGYLLKPCTEERLFSEIETVLIRGVK